MKDSRQEQAKIPKNPLLPLGLGLLLGGICLSAGRSGSFDFLESGRFLQAKFEVREKLSRTPKISPKIKVLAIDDGMVAKIRRPALNDREWLQVFDSVAKRKPAVILVDKVFFGLKPEGLKEEIKALQSNEVPIVVGGFFANEEIRFRSVAPRIFSLQRKGDFEDLREKWKFFYGPSPEALEFRIFSSLGHVNGLQAGTVDVIRGDMGGRVVPHLSIAGLSAAIGAADFGVVEKIKQFETSNFRKIPNFSSLKELRERTRSLLGIYARAVRGIPISSVQQGDIVLILPEMYTGNTDFSNTPIGRIPGGYVITSVLNDFITERHIKEVSSAWEYLLLLVFALLVHRMRFPSHAILLGLSVGAIFIFASFVGFTYFDMQVPLVGSLGFVFINILTGATGSRVLYDRLVRVLQVVRKEKQIAERHLKEASDMAFNLKQASVDQYGDYRVSHFHKLFEHASGDWFAVESSPSGRYVQIILVDVTGHGLQAAMVVSSCRTVLSLMLDQPGTHSTESNRFPVEYATKLNIVLFKNASGKHTTALTALCLDTQSGRVDYCLAANPPMLQIPAMPSDSPKLFRQPNTPLGFASDTAYKSLSFQLDPGACLILNSDGFLTRGKKFLKLAQDMDFSQSTAEDLAERLREKSMQALDDDLTLLVIKRDSA